MNALDLEQNLPAHDGRELDDDVGEDGRADPAVVGITDRERHRGSDCGIVKDPVEERARDEQLQDGEQYFFHSPNCSFHRLTDNRISSAVRRGLISQTNKQFGGRSGTSFSRSTMPVNGAW